MTSAYPIVIAAFLLLVSIQAADSTTSQLSSSSRIANGRTGSPVKFASVSLYRNGRHFCSASLIASNWVLSAAHCGTGPFVVYIRGSNPRSRGIRRNVARVVRHPSYRRDRGRYAELNDIMLIRLDRGVSGARMSLSRRGIGSRTMTASGYGTTPSGGSGTLRHVGGLRSASCPTTANSYKAFMHVCVRSQNRGGICGGDSGGPLVGRVNGNWAQFGISSQGSCGAAGALAGIFTRVDNYRSWINRVTGNKARFV